MLIEFAAHSDWQRHLKLCCAEASRGASAVDHDALDHRVGQTPTGRGGETCRVDVRGHHVEGVGSGRHVGEAAVAQRLAQRLRHRIGDAGERLDGDAARGAGIDRIGRQALEHLGNRIGEDFAGEALDLLGAEVRTQQIAATGIRSKIHIG